MGRFINLGIAIVNADYIIRVETEQSGRAEVYMSDGTMFRCENFKVSELYGCGHVTSLVPCEGVDAVYNDGFRTIHVPVHTLAVNAAGEVYPLHQTNDDGSEINYGQFMGLCERLSDG